MKNNPYFESTFQAQDPHFELSLRPTKLQEFVGQRLIIDRLQVVIEAANQRKGVLGHLLFSGPPGLGKTTLCHLISKEMQTNLVAVSGPALEKAGDLAGILTNLQKGDIFFIDEIHRLNKIVEEYLYSAMENFTLDLIIDQGANARSVQVTLNPFTMIGATTRSGMLSAPMRSRFSNLFRLDHYPQDELELILMRSSKLLNLNLEKKACEHIAMRSRGSPRIANNLLKWVRDYSQIKSKQPTIDASVAKSALDMIGIDLLGLDELDMKLLKVMIEHYKGGPVGLNTLAIAVGEEPHTIEEVHEPYLIIKGLVKRTSRGRLATDLAKKHLNKQVKKD
jgi:Holliday junction DNA helicase RuvB